MSTLTDLANATAARQRRPREDDPADEKWAAERANERVRKAAEAHVLDAVMNALLAGIVVTVETVPLAPLAMRNYVLAASGRVTR